MRKLRMAVVLFFIVSCICYGVYEVVVWKQSDHNIPVIHIEEDVLVISAEATDEELLAGVTAEDVESGDLTDRIQIASMSPLVGEDERTIQYIVFDDANQLGTAQRTIRYNDYVSPRIYLKEPLRFTTEKFSSEISRMEISAWDMLDGSLTGRLRTSYTSDYGEMFTGEHDITFQVNNSAGDTRILPLKMTIVDAEDEEEKFYPLLSDYIVYTSVGERLDLEKYLKGLDADGTKFAFDSEEEETEGSEGTEDVEGSEGTGDAEGAEGTEGGENTEDTAETGDTEGIEDMARTSATGTSVIPEEEKNVLTGVYAEDVSISSEVDYTVPGVYAVNYSYTTPDKITAVTTLYVVVEE